MPTLKSLLITSFVSLNGIISFGQTEPIPPPPPPMEMAMPTEINTKIVDEIVKVTRHEKYFTDYCIDKVKRFGRSNAWTTGRTNEILGSIKFEFYKSTIYNSYAVYSTEQLNKILETLTIVNSKSGIDLTMILTNSMMQSNLDLFVEALIAGKYIVKN